MNPIEQAFHAAKAICGPVCKLANEWRDTLLYTGIAVGLGFALVHGGGRASANMAQNIVLQRELIRALMWNFGKFKKIAGYDPVPVDRAKNSLAALFVVASVGMVGEMPPLSTHVHTFGLTVQVVAGTLTGLGLYGRGSGVRDIPALYFHDQTGMWDWPRKQGGGTTQTQKLKNAFGKFGRTLAGYVPVPRPAYSPSPVASRSSAEVG
ncbi:MAG: hypothetical protein KGI37_04200 [Alphaproteobacteria bacterium]|nr:hypothetical protein [Alphaproteobacteria bacterium]